MGLYSILVRPFARRMNLESASKFALRYFEFVEKIPGGRLISRWIHNNRPVGLQREVFGLDFYNPVGLGAGLDIHGELYNDLNNLGFSFVEIGPMDANGVRRAVRRIQEDPQDDILAVCINADYLTAFTLAYDFCDFFVLDFSTTPFSTEIVDTIMDARVAEDVYKPVVIKLPKIISNTEIEEIADYSLMNGIDGIEARDIAQVRLIASYTREKLPIIANTHIESPKQAEEVLKAGASLIEVRNGLVREGPLFVGSIQKHLLSVLKNERTHPTEDRSAAESQRTDA